MSNDNLIQFGFRIPLSLVVALEYRALKRNSYTGILIRAAIDQFIDKYNPQDTEKVNQWVPPQIRLQSHLRVVHLYQAQYEALRDIATKKNQSLDSLEQKVLMDDAIGSAITEYLGLPPSWVR